MMQIPLPISWCIWRFHENEDRFICHGLKDERTWVLAMFDCEFKHEHMTRVIPRPDGSIFSYRTVSPFLEFKDDGDAVMFKLTHL